MISIKPKSYKVIDEVDDGFNGFNNVVEMESTFENEVKEYVIKNKPLLINKYNRCNFNIWSIINKRWCMYTKKFIC